MYKVFPLCVLLVKKESQYGSMHKTKVSSSNLQRCSVTIHLLANIRVSVLLMEMRILKLYTYNIPRACRCTEIFHNE